MQRFLLSWGAAIFLLGDLTCPGQAGIGEKLQLQIIYFNFEMVQVTWNASEYSGTNLTFLYTFSSEGEYDQCTRYILQHSHTVGCLLDTNDDGILYFSIRNGLQPVLTESRWITDYLKPSSPRGLRFLWCKEQVTVTCSNLSYGDFLYEVQHRSTFDTTWQSKEEKTCHVTVRGLDAEKCYYLRARVKTDELSYGPSTYPSDWSEVTFWQGGQRRDSCPEEQQAVEPKFPKFILICSLVSLLTVWLLLLSLWKLRRVKKLLIPSIPDPKASFPGLFEQHQGNFQEWIKDTQDVAQLNKMGSGGEQDCGPEDALVVQVANVPKTMGPVCLKMGDEESSRGSLQFPHQLPKGGNVVSLGGFTFVTSDNSYVML
ncbi:cytokine receptor-like factor 2 isoform X2 [Nycticebus coucang]|uniref:cytokine receptor-like factor 2 isoform X2 n=1 Tax=Nycticebus coucang TaxID=9470 RepID=UPI00234D10E9|nr:cytokine receptor-like factor 2 isoform X2 [Nycticebus coucang]